MTKKNSPCNLEGMMYGLLTTDIACVACNKTHALLSVRVPREVIARNDVFLGFLSELASDFDIAPAPLPKRRNLTKELLKVPFGYICADEEYVVFSIRILRKSVARNHGVLTLLAALAAGATPSAEAMPQARSR
jgi:hypothetical protein